MEMGLKDDGSACRFFVTYVKFVGDDGDAVICRRPAKTNEVDAADIADVQG